MSTCGFLDHRIAVLEILHHWSFGSCLYHRSISIHAFYLVGNTDYTCILSWSFYFYQLLCLLYIKSLFNNFRWNHQESHECSSTDTNKLGSWEFLSFFSIPFCTICKTQLFTVNPATKWPFLSLITAPIQAMWFLQLCKKRLHLVKLVTLFSSNFFIASG